MKSFTISTEINNFKKRSLCLLSSVKPVIRLLDTKTSWRECYCLVKEHHVTLKWHICRKTTREEYSHNAGTSLVSCILKSWQSQEVPGGWEGRETFVSPDSALNSGCTAGSAQCPLQQPWFSRMLIGFSPEVGEEEFVPHVDPILTSWNPPHPSRQGFHCSTRFPPSDLRNDQKPLGARSR